MAKEEAIEQLCEWHAIMTGEGAPTHSLHLKNVKVIEMCIEALEQTSWIPVSESLPEEYIHVLCQFCMGGMAECYYAHNFFHVVGGLRVNSDEVLAWQPLPQPYKAESEDME